MGTWVVTKKNIEPILAIKFHDMTLDEFLNCFEYLAQAIEPVDEAAHEVFKLSLYS